MEHHRYNVIVILGPTASGKSKLGIQLAKKFNGVVISADSRQVYRGMNIGTGKVTKKEMSDVPHYLLDVTSPRGQYSVSRYVDDVGRALKRIKPSTPIFLVGGSPFYIKAVTLPGSFSNVKPNTKLRIRLERLNNAKLRTILNRKNPHIMQNIDLNNKRRLIRAIEIASSQNVHKPSVLPPFRIIRIGIYIPRLALHKNIDRRVDQRMKQGMIAEVRRLHQQGLLWKRLDAFGLEYRYISRYLQGQLTKEEMLEKLKTEIYRFAKRQMTWWRKDQDIVWIEKPRKAEKIIRKFLHSR